MVVSDFRSLRKDIVFRSLFGASVSGGKNPVPNSTSQESAGRGEVAATLVANALFAVPRNHIVRRHFDGHIRKGTKARHGVLLIPSRLWSRDLLHEAIAIVDWRDRVPKAAAIPE